jgi:hypothetical protein
MGDMMPLGQVNFTVLDEFKISAGRSGVTFTE